nr:glycosyltransferase [Oscillochloris trichoides]
MSLPSVDVVIATRNRAELIEPLIASIRQSSHTDLTLWIVDQSDDAATERVVTRHSQTDQRVRYVRQSLPGASLARNVGASAGSAPLILFTDDDCRVHPEWVAEMAHELINPCVWAVFGRVLPIYPASEHLLAGTNLRLLDTAVKTSLQRRVYVRNRLDLSFGHGASMGVRRDAFQQVGGFDPVLGAGGALRAWEDRDLGYRILRAGGRIVYTPKALLHHLQWRHWSAVRRNHWNYALGTGAAVGKYLRCGDLIGWAILFEWFWSQGIRQSLSALLKWRSLQRFWVGLIHLWGPWLGLIQSLRFRVQRQYCLYQPPGHVQSP